MAFSRFEIYKALYSRREPQVSSDVRNTILSDYQHWTQEVVGKVKLRSSTPHYRKHIEETKALPISPRKERLANFVGSLTVRFLEFMRNWRESGKDSVYQEEAQRWGEILKTGLVLNTYYWRKGGDGKADEYFEEIGDPAPEDVLILLGWGFKRELGRGTVVNIVHDLLRQGR